MSSIPSVPLFALGCFACLAACSPPPRTASAPPRPPSPPPVSAPAPPPPITVARRVPADAGPTRVSRQEVDQRLFLPPVPMLPELPTAGAFPWVALPSQRQAPPLAKTLPGETTARGDTDEGRERQVLDEVNARRAEGGTCGGHPHAPAAPLVLDEALGRAAREHSADMARRGYFSHDAPDGRTVGARLAAQGFHGKTWGENIAAGRATARETVEQWMASPGHCENLLSPAFTRMGVGFAESDGAQGGFRFYWTQDLGG